MIKYYSYKNKNDLLNCKEFIFNLINDGNIVLNYYLNVHIGLGGSSTTYKFNWFILLKENIANYMQLYRGNLCCRLIENNDNITNNMDFYNHLFQHHDYTKTKELKPFYRECIDIVNNIVNLPVDIITEIRSHYYQFRTYATTSKFNNNIEYINNKYCNFLVEYLSTYRTVKEPFIQKHIFWEKCVRKWNSFDDAIKNSYNNL